MHVQNYWRARRAEVADQLCNVSSHPPPLSLPCLPWQPPPNTSDRCYACAESAYDGVPGELQWQTSGAPHQLHMAPAAKQPPLPGGVKKKEGVVRRRKDPFVGSPSPEQAIPAGLPRPPPLQMQSCCNSPPPSQVKAELAETSLLFRSAQTACLRLFMVQQECDTDHGMLGFCRLHIYFHLIFDSKV